MIIRLILFFVLYTVLAGGGIALLSSAARYLLNGPLKGWQNKQLGRRNAKLLEAKKEENCFVCTHPVNPEVDVYDARYGWCHSTCFNEEFS